MPKMQGFESAVPLACTPIAFHYPYLDRGKPKEKDRTRGPERGTGGDFRLEDSFNTLSTFNPPLPNFLSIPLVPEQTVKAGRSQSLNAERSKSELPNTEASLM